MGRQTICNLTKQIIKVLSKTVYLGLSINFYFSSNAMEIGTLETSKPFSLSQLIKYLKVHDVSLARNIITSNPELIFSRNSIDNETPLSIALQILPEIHDEKIKTEYFVLIGDIMKQHIIKNCTNCLKGLDEKQLEAFIQENVYDLAVQKPLINMLKSIKTSEVDDDYFFAEFSNFNHSGLLNFITKNPLWAQKRSKNGDTTLGFAMRNISNIEIDRPLITCLITTYPKLVLLKNHGDETIFYILHSFLDTANHEVKIKSTKNIENYKECISLALSQCLLDDDTKNSCTTLLQKNNLVEIANLFMNHPEIINFVDRKNKTILFYINEYIKKNKPTNTVNEMIEWIQKLAPNLPETKTELNRRPSIIESLSERRPSIVESIYSFGSRLGLKKKDSLKDPKKSSLLQEIQKTNSDSVSLEQYTFGKELEKRKYSDVEVIENIEELSLYSFDTSENLDSDTSLQEFKF